MPKSKLIRSCEHPYHIVARSNNRERFDLPDATVFSLMSEKLQTISERYNLRVISFLLMPNHFHLLALTPDENIDSAMNYFMREVSRRIGRASGRINHTFGGRYKWCLVNTPQYLAHVYRYVYQNPLRAHLVRTVEEYRFSTLPAILGRVTAPFPIDESYLDALGLVPKEPKDRLIWLNQAYQQPVTRLIKRSLRHPAFKLTTRRNEAKWIRHLQYQK